MDDVREQVRQRYALAAVQASNDGCCGAVAAAPARSRSTRGSVPRLYDAPRSRRPARPRRSPRRSAAATRSTVAELRAGERVLDLGSGGGIDVLLSARRVGPTGFAYGVDMTDEMLDLARANADRAGATNVEFRKGTIEDLPLARRLGRRRHLQLRRQPVHRQAGGPGRGVPGARPTAVGSASPTSSPRTTSPPQERAERGSYVGCIAGRAVPHRVPRRASPPPGFVDAEVTFTHQVADGMHGAVVRARKPSPQE